MARRCHLIVPRLAIVLFLLLSRDFPLRRLLFIEPQGLNRASPIKIRNGEVGHNQSKGFAVRRVR